MLGFLQQRRFQSHCFVRCRSLKKKQEARVDDSSLTIVFNKSTNFNQNESKNGDP